MDREKEKFGIQRQFKGGSNRISQIFGCGGVGEGGVQNGLFYYWVIGRRRMLIIKLEDIYS